MIERDGGTLYCTALFIAPDGYLGKHRKLLPTAVGHYSRPDVFRLVVDEEPKHSAISS